MAQNRAIPNRAELKPGVYREGKDGQLYAITNVDIATMWPGVWKEDTNGLRVQLHFEADGGKRWMQIGVGSVISNSTGEYVGAPGGNFKKFELQDSNGVLVPFVKGVALESRFPHRISIRDFPRWPNGGLKTHIGFFTNGGPFTLQDVDFDSLYRIPKEADYTLTVCPVIYKFGTNTEYLDRVELPCVTTKIHLTPAQ